MATRIRHQTAITVFSAVGVLGVGYVACRYGNKVEIPEGSIGLIQDLSNGQFRKEIVPPGKHYFSVLVYVHKQEITPRPVNVDMKITSSDKQLIPVTIIAENRIDDEELQHLANLYGLETYQDDFTKQICKKEATKLLEQHTLVEWLEKYDSFQGELSTNIQKQLEQKKLITSKVTLYYDTEYIEKLFKYFYSEEELAEISGYQNIKNMPVLKKE